MYVKKGLLQLEHGFENGYFVRGKDVRNEKLLSYHKNFLNSFTRFLNNFVWTLLWIPTPFLLSV